MEFLKILGPIMLVIQFLLSIALILIIAIQTTKSEQSSGLGWGTIGGQASTTVRKFGLEAQLTRLTTWVAVAFFVSSFLTAWIYAAMR